MNKIDTEYTFKVSLTKFGYEIRCWVYVDNDKFSKKGLNAHIESVVNVVTELFPTLDTENVHAEIHTIAEAVLQVADFSAVEVIATQEGRIYEVPMDTLEICKMDTDRIGIVLYKNWSTTE